MKYNFKIILLILLSIFSISTNAGLWTSYSPPNSSVYLTSGNGYGSTNTKIRRFTNNTVVGTDITYADTAAAGASFTINVAGNYAIQRCDYHSGANADIGLSLNSNQLTTNISTITASMRIAIFEMPAITVSAVNATGASANCIARSLYLASGDVVRPHDNLQNDGGASVYVWMVISRVN